MYKWFVCSVVKNYPEDMVVEQCENDVVSTKNFNPSENEMWDMIKNFCEKYRGEVVITNMIRLE